jgi:hypothetical protein
MGEMLNMIISEYPGLALTSLIILLVAFGYAEKRVLGNTDLACGTWFFALLILCTAIVSIQWLGNLRWVLALCTLVGGTVYLIKYAREARLLKRIQR